MSGSLCSSIDSQGTNKHTQDLMMPPVSSRPSGKENTVYSQRGESRIRDSQHSRHTGTEMGWVGRIVPIVFGPHENWGLSLLVGERRVDLGRCRVAARIGCVFCCLGCSAEMATKAALYGASWVSLDLHWVASDIQRVGWPSPSVLLKT